MELDIHRGVSLVDSIEYRTQLQDRYWDAMDRLESARIALAAINNHIQTLRAEELPDGA